MAACVRCGEANSDGARFCSHCGAPLAAGAAPPARARKTVTVLFSDVRGFTGLGERLDPESLQQVMTRYFREMALVIERHGGKVEQYMGDAVMAIFGVPVLHEDDALRAGRAAVEMRDTLAGLNPELDRRWGVRLEARTGVNTGEVVIGEGPGGAPFTLGDAVNVAQRLETAAPPGQVLVGPETARLLAGGARLEPVEALRPKGKSTTVAAWRLFDVASAETDVQARPSPPLVDRVEELRLLRETFAGVVQSRQPRLLTVLGPPGIGKSRLVRALLSEVSADAQGLIGRCLPYGEGITYWPLAEIARQLAGAPEEARLAALAGGSEEVGRAAAQVARAAGFAVGSVPVEETRWAVRRLLEHAAEDHPLVVVVEDVHWAEPTLLDLLEHVAATASGAPLLLVCVARPELLDERPSWSRLAEDRHVLVPLEPLSQDHAGELLAHLTGDILSADDHMRLLEAAEGNPFFLEQMVAMRAEAGSAGAGAGVPLTIQAVLAARIDRLPAEERAVVERASIEGRAFHRSALAALLPEDERGWLDDRIAALIRRGLIAPGPSDFEGDAGYRFTHILIRDAAYALVPKQLRADLHEWHARWLERRHGVKPLEHGEIVGYHLEQAFRCRIALEPAAGQSYQRLAGDASAHLGAAGRAALRRGDLPAAIALLERAANLVPDGDPGQSAVLTELGTALTEAGRLPDAERALDGAVARARERVDSVAEAHAIVGRLFARLQVDTEAATQEVRERFEVLLATFERAGDEQGLDRLWRARALVHWIEARAGEAERAWERAVTHAERAKDTVGLVDGLAWLASAAALGPTPAPGGIARCEAIRDRLRGDRRGQALVLAPLAGLRAMRGEFDAARDLLDQRNSILAELGVTMHTAVSHYDAFVAFLAGDAAAAERSLREGYDRLADMGEKALLATTAAMLARALQEQGRNDEAWELTTAAERAAAPDDLSAQVLWRAVRAQLLARRDAAPEADRLSAEAVVLAEGTDWLNYHGDALSARADVLLARDETEGAIVELHASLALYERKGNIVAASRGRLRLAACLRT